VGLVYDHMGLSGVTTARFGVAGVLQQHSRSQKEMKWQDSILCKLKLKELILYLILSIDYRSIKRDTTWIANKVSILT
jgi:hypothetical protein